MQTGDCLSQHAMAIPNIAGVHKPLYARFPIIGEGIGGGGVLHAMIFFSKPPQVKPPSRK